MSDGTVVVLTALNLECQAVRGHLTEPRRITHPAGTRFEIARLHARSGQIALAVIGEGTTGAAVLTERAITMFQPLALLFVGIAGGLKTDIQIGDVVVATRVYSYHGGKEDRDGFSARPRAWDSHHRLDQIARAVELTQSWIEFLPVASRTAPPAVHFKPIAAGDVLLDGRHGPLAQQIQRSYGDAAAVEMESSGVAHAGHLNDSLPVLTIRGISDKADGNKHRVDRQGSQLVATTNAAAFAIAVANEIFSAADIDWPASATPGPLNPNPQQQATADDHPEHMTDLKDDGRGQPVVHLQDARGVQIGDHNVQINHY